MSGEDSLFCYACKYPISENIGSCPNCGTWLDSIESEQVKEESGSDEISAIPEVPNTNTIEFGVGQTLDRQETTIGKLIDEDDETFCSHCGSVHSPEARFCPKTGKLIRDDSASKLCDTSTPDRRSDTPIDLQLRIKTLWFIGIVITVLLLFISIAVVGERPSKSNGLLQVEPSPSHTSVYMNVPVSEQTSTVTISNSPIASLSPSAAHTITALPSKTHVPSKSPTPSPKPTLGIGSTTISNRDGMELAYVPEGEFLMGLNDSDVAEFLNICPSCDTWSLRDQRPQNEIFLDSYWIDRTEVTNAQFAKFVAATGYTTTAEQKGMSYVMIRGKADFIYIDDADWRHPFGSESDIVAKGDYPATQVSWDDAVAYCGWAGRRLPTEAEWEKAARGVAGGLFPWGNTAPSDDLLNYNFNYAGPIDVGSFPDGVSSYGAFDMAGNVWEWIADFYSEYYYQTMPEMNPEGPGSGDGHPLRGGSWASERGPFMMYTLSTFRLWNYPYIRSNVIGFRCAMDG